jgi:hypothetical protein
MSLDTRKRSQATSPSMRNKMAALLIEQPSLTQAKAARAAFQRKYGIGVSDSVYFNALRDIRESSSVSHATEIDSTATKQTQLPSAAPVELAESKLQVPSVESFVSDDLLNSIAKIKAACDNVGGLDTAEAVANTIRTAGGVDNFLAAIKLLREVIKANASVPSDVNARL